MTATIVSDVPVPAKVRDALLVVAANVELDVDGSDGLHATAWITGATWVATSCHVIAVDFHSDRPAAWRALLADVAQGTTPCTAEVCDTCG